MSSDALDFAANQLQALKNALKNYKTHTTSQAVIQQNASKLPKLKTQFRDVEAKLGKAVEAAPATDKEMEKIRKEYKLLQGEFEKIDRAVTITLQSANHSSASSSGAASSSAATASGSNNTGNPTSQLGTATKYDTATLELEEHLKKKQLEGILEIEQSANELKGMFTEVRDMLNQQQGGLDTVTKNVDKSIDHVQRGTQQIRQARKM